jgi:hypothetical protein
MVAWDGGEGNSNNTNVSLSSNMIHRLFSILPSCTGFFHSHSNTNVGEVLNSVNGALVGLSCAFDEREKLQLREQWEN